MIYCLSRRSLKGVEMKQYYVKLRLVHETKGVIDAGFPHNGFPASFNATLEEIKLEFERRKKELTECYGQEITGVVITEIGDLEY